MFLPHRISHLAAVALALMILLPAAAASAGPGAQTAVTVSKLALGWDHTCALTTTGGVKCWGSNSNGQLGNGSTQSRAVPRDVYGLTSGVTDIAAGAMHTCAVVNGGLKCWGSNDNGQLGDNTDDDRWLPVDVSGLTSGVSAVAAGDAFTCAVTSSGGLKCWGDNDNGQLGDGSKSDRWTPDDVTGLTSDVDAVTAGAQHACARTSSSGAKCWGQNDNGQLGDSTKVGKTAPVDVSGMGLGVRTLVAGSSHTCVRTTWNSAMCWGFNGSGQVGDGTRDDRTKPTNVSGLNHSVIDITAKGSHSCVAWYLSGAKCWGFNGQGGLGDGTTERRTEPVDVLYLTEEVSDIAGGSRFTCAVVGGGVKCWGANDDGQLGDGTTTDRWTPVDVLLQPLYLPGIIKG
jgi:alpha-tubulin suppressor-like RCC1 family protein